MVNMSGQQRRAIVFAVAQSSPFYSSDLSLEDTVPLGRAVTLPVWRNKVIRLTTKDADTRK